MTGHTQEVTRTLRVLVPLIKDELARANEAGIVHYRRAGEMLVEAKNQVATGDWHRWLANNFRLSKSTAQLYMKLAEMNADTITAVSGGRVSLNRAVRSATYQRASAWYPAAKASVNRVDVDRMAQERQNRETERRLERELALRLIDIGFKVLAGKLHPDHRGGSREAMARLNRVRERLKQNA